MADSTEASRLTTPLLDRPESQRLQEYKYRFAQSVIFGLPVVALQVIGRSLGGPESDRWVTLFQSLLAGWVMYAGALGMITEGAMLLLDRRRPPPRVVVDLVVASAAVALFLLGLPRLAMLLATVDGGKWPAAFHWSIVLIAAWCGLRWWQTRRLRSGQEKGSAAIGRAQGS